MFLIEARVGVAWFRRVTRTIAFILLSRVARPSSAWADFFLRAGPAFLSGSSTEGEGCPILSAFSAERVGGEKLNWKTARCLRLTFAG